MKCIRCDRDAKRKDREAAKGCCPHCQHPFTTIPDKDYVTDKLVMNAENVIDSNGTFHFLPAHLKYEVDRRRLRSASSAGKAAVGSAVLFVLSLFLGFWAPVVFVLSFALASVARPSGG